MAVDVLAHSIHQLNKQFGPVAVVCMADASNETQAVPTGAAALDEALGIGGVPCGRLTEIYGPPSAGKTSLALSIAAQAQEAGGAVGFVDAEHSLNWEYALQLGIVPELFYISQPDSCEEALEICLGMVQSGRMAVVIIDSIAALVPKAEVEGKVGESHPGLQAALISQWLRKLSAPLERSGTALVVTNQLRTKVGVMFGNPQTTCGGNALRFFASVRLDIRKVDSLRVQNRIVGSVVRVTVRKSRVGVPFSRAEFGLVFGMGLADDIKTALAEVEHGS